MRRHVVTGLVGAALLAACTGSPVKVDPPNSPNAVVSSADRMRDRQTRLGGSSACLQDAYCAAGLTRASGISVGGTVQLDTPAAVVDALSAGAVDVGALPAYAVETSDSRIAVLEDDRSLRPADNVVPVISPPLAITGGPALLDAVDAVSAALTPGGLAAVEQALAGGAPPELAAAGWLQAHTVTVRSRPANDHPVVVGARRDGESQAVSDIYAGALERAGWPVSVAPIDGGRLAALDALELGHVGLVPDTAAGLLEQLDGYAGAATANLGRTMALLRAQLADLGLLAFAPAGAAPQTVFAVSRAVATALSVSSLSGLARATGARLPAVPPPPPLTADELAADTETPSATAPLRLGAGSSGAAVAAIQLRLALLGYRAPQTGAFDERTRRAVVSFQIDQGLIDDGEVDATTLRALQLARPTTRPGAAPAAGDPGTVRVPPSAAGARVVYLAFAGGPSVVTPQVLELMSRVGARATFFADGEEAAADPEAVRQVLAAGDAVGISTSPHLATSPVAMDALFRTVTASQVTIAAADGQTPTCLVLPYGATGGAVRAPASNLGLHPVLWDVDPMDWTHPGADAIANDVLAAVRPGSVILLHDGGGDRAQTVTALETILPSLTAAGYTFAPIPGC